MAAPDDGAGERKRKRKRVCRPERLADEHQASWERCCLPQSPRYCFSSSTNLCGAVSRSSSQGCPYRLCITFKLMEDPILSSATIPLNNWWTLCMGIVVRQANGRGNTTTCLVSIACPVDLVRWATSGFDSGPTEFSTMDDSREK